MSVGEAFAATVAGQWDAFDKITGLIDRLRQRVQAADESEFPVEYHAATDTMFGTVGPHLHDPRQSMIDELAEAKRNIEVACLTCQTIMAALPDKE